MRSCKGGDAPSAGAGALISSPSARLDCALRFECLAKWRVLEQGLVLEEVDKNQPIVSVGCTKIVVATDSFYSLFLQLKRIRAQS